MTFLAGDIGGTHVRLALAESPPSPNGIEISHQQIFLSGSFESFEDILQIFLGETRARPVASCFAVAGPVIQGYASVTNLPWELEEGRLSAQMGIKKVRLVNDFEAVGYGISGLSKDDVFILQAGNVDLKSTRAVIGAGTGLGEAIIVQCASGEKVICCENGHADFAPTNELEIALWHALKHGRSRVSNEDILSGKGIPMLMEFLSSHKDIQPADHLKAALESSAKQDWAAMISQAAVLGSDKLAQQTMDLFIGIYGSRAGNLALTSLPRGGLYIAGSIASKILPLLQSGLFISRFVNKPPMKSLLASIPVYVVRDELVGLSGALRIAANMV